MHKVVALFIIIVALFACETKTVVGDSRSVSGSWEKNSEMIFELPEMDSLKQYDVFLHLRNSNEYPFNNIFIVASLDFPHGKTISDTLEYKMARPDGTWLGEGIGSIKESKLWFKKGFQFVEPGKYTIRIGQAVRNNGDVEGVSNLIGITDVGFTIEETSH